VLNDLNPQTVPVALKPAFTIKGYVTPKPYMRSDSVKSKRQFLLKFVRRHLPVSFLAV